MNIKMQYQFMEKRTASDNSGSFVKVSHEATAVQLLFHSSMQMYKE